MDRAAYIARMKAQEAELARQQSTPKPVPGVPPDRGGLSGEGRSDHDGPELARDDAARGPSRPQGPESADRDTVRNTPSPKAESCRETPVDHLLADLNRAGIRLELNDAGKIRAWFPRGALTEQLRDRIQRLSDDLIVILI